MQEKGEEKQKLIMSRFLYQEKKIITKKERGVGEIFREGMSKSVIK